MGICLYGCRKFSLWQLYVELETHVTYFNTKNNNFLDQITVIKHLRFDYIYIFLRLKTFMHHFATGCLPTHHLMLLKMSVFNTEVRWRLQMLRNSLPLQTSMAFLSVEQVSNPNSLKSLMLLSKIIHLS